MTFSFVGPWATAGVFTRSLTCFAARELAFHSDQTATQDGQVPVFFLHRALHLLVRGNGVTKKLSRTTVRTLLEQFGLPPDDPQARPLLVTEGSAQGKRRAIEGNPYLSHALRRLRERRGPTVVFGSRLSDQDAHLAEALNEHPERPVAVSMRPGTKQALAPKQMAIFARLRANRLLSFDATTHPLGSSDLRIPDRNL